MKKLLIAFLVVALVFALIPYNVDAHTSCNAKLIAREKELIASIQNLEAQKIDVEYYWLGAFIQYLLMDEICSDSGMTCGMLDNYRDEYMRLQAEMDMIDAKIAQTKAELSVVQAKLKKSCRHR